MIIIGLLKRRGKRKEEINYGEKIREYLPRVLYSY